MIWRFWTLVAGLPLGALVGLAALGARASVPVLLFAAAAGGCVLAAAAAGIARSRDDDPARGAHLAAAASTALAALPALVATWLGMPPGGSVWSVGITLATALALLRASRTRAPSGGLLRQLRVGLIVLLAGVLVALAAAGIPGAWQGTGPVHTEALAAAVWDADARVATRSIPTCASRPTRVDVLLDRGARPRLDKHAGALWFDARDARGLRQIHRLDLAGGDVVCWTCDEAGHNLRPAPDPRGSSVVFETDRHASWREPANIEIQRLDTPPGGPRHPSRRLTFAPGPDDHALFAPGAPAIVWSRRDSRGYAVVSAAIRRGHGGLLLGPQSVLVRAGARWAAPVVWSPDAHALVVLRGNPFHPASAAGIDFAREISLPLGDDVADGGADFSADGGVVVVASSRRARVAGLLPHAFGLWLGPLAGHVGRDAALLRETRLRIGPVSGEILPLELGGVARWGAPTGVALTPDGQTVFLAQRRAEPGPDPERILEIELDCDPPPGS